RPRPPARHREVLVAGAAGGCRADRDHAARGRPAEESVRHLNAPRGAASNAFRLLSGAAMLSFRLLVLLALAAGAAGCTERATLPLSSGTGPEPVLPQPVTTPIPTVHIAPAAGWPDGAKPVAAAGTQVAAFATG